MSFLRSHFESRFSTLVASDCIVRCERISRFPQSATNNDSDNPTTRQLDNLSSNSQPQTYKPNHMYPQHTTLNRLSSVAASDCIVRCGRISRFSQNKTNNEQRKTNNVFVLFLFSLTFLLHNTGWGQISIASSGTAYTQNFDGIGTSATASLPANWRAQDNASTTRAWGIANVLSATTLRGGTTSSAISSGFYNWGNGDPAAATDRSLGFLSGGTGSYLCSATKPLDIYQLH
jgi:hypothetical protein